MFPNDLQTLPSTILWAVRMADSALAGYPRLLWKWQYEHGLFLKAVLMVAEASGNICYEGIVHEWVDHFVTPKGRIRTYHLSDYNLDQINPGNLLLHFYPKNGNERYKLAIELLFRQLRSQPRTRHGGFWHKKIYPHQIWLDGLYMAQPFYAGCARLFHQPELFDDITHQIIEIEKLTRDERTGLLYHGWDERRQQKWADAQTGCSPSFWGRAMGWYAMALVDVLDFLPERHPDRQALIDILGRLAEALSRFQDAASGLWYQVVNLPGRAGNYLESSVSAMLAYAFAKGVRMEYLPVEYLPVARRAYYGLLENKIKVDARGRVTLEGTCGAAGLGGDPYRDGSFEYYIGEQIIANDFKGVAPFIFASLELNNNGVE